MQLMRTLMTRLIFLALILFFSILAEAQEAPKVMKTSFSKKSLSQMVYTSGGDSLTMKSVLKKYRKQVVVLDLWASWCKDCMAVIEENRALRKQYPKVKFVYLSLDRNEAAWLKSLEKHGLTNEANYWLKAGWKNDFTNYIDLNWIPRYMVLDKKSKIKGYYFVEPKDKEFLNLLDKLTK